MIISHPNVYLLLNRRTEKGHSSSVMEELNGADRSYNEWRDSINEFKE